MPFADWGMMPPQMQAPSNPIGGGGMNPLGGMPIQQGQSPLAGGGGLFGGMQPPIEGMPSGGYNPQAAMSMGSMFGAQQQPGPQMFGPSNMPQIQSPMMNDIFSRSSTWNAPAGGGGFQGMGMDQPMQKPMRAPQQSTGRDWNLAPQQPTQQPRPVSYGGLFGNPQRRNPILDMWGQNGFI